MLKSIALSAVFSAMFSIVLQSSLLAADVDTSNQYQSKQNVPFDWNGRYAGVQIGSAAGSADFSIDGFGLVTSASPDGIVAGVLAGVNWHSDNFLVGIEGDANYANIDDTGAGIMSVKFNTEAFASLRVRFGITNDNLLLYGTAGGAYIRASHQANTFGVVFDNDNSGFTTTWGGGVEYAFDNRVTLRLDFRHYDNYGKSYGLQQTVQSILPPHSVSTEMDVVSVALTKFF